MLPAMTPTVERQNPYTLPVKVLGLLAALALGWSFYAGAGLWAPGKPLRTPLAPHGIVSLALAPTEGQAQAILAEWGCGAGTPGPGTPCAAAQETVRLDHRFVWAYLAAWLLVPLWATVAGRNSRKVMVLIMAAVAVGALLDMLENALVERALTQTLNFEPHEWDVPQLSDAARARLRVNNPQAIERFDAKVAAARRAAGSSQPLTFVPAASWDEKRFLRSPGLVVLEIIVGIAPLLGLVGTILGMMTTFEGVGQMGLNDAAGLARGIALILKATLIGLLIAIPALISWSYYTKKVEMLAVEMETLCDELVRRLYRNEVK